MTTGNDATYWTLIADAAQRQPNRPLLADDYGRSLSARQLHDAASATAAAFAERGVGAGTMVSWQLPTTLEAVVVMAALIDSVRCKTRSSRYCGSARSVSSPSNWQPNSLWCLNFGGDSITASLPGSWPRSRASRLSPSTWRHPRSPVSFGCPVLALMPSRQAPAPDGDTQWIYYSSGTTAAPKGIRHTDSTVVAGSRGLVTAMGITAGDVDPIAFPIAHIGGAAMVAAALMTGMRLALFEVFDPAATPLAIAAHNPTFLGTATPFFVAFLEAQRAHGDQPLFGALRGCIAGGAPITAELGRQVRETFGMAGIANAWGMTEFPVATSPPLDAAAEVLDYTVGAPVPGVSVRVVDGELRLKGPQCFLGYADAALDADAFDEDGWLRTGDLGLIDADGNVRVTGRIKDAIIRNAENVSALEIENVLATHPAVADVAVIGVPDHSAGERVCAVVVPISDEGVSLESLVQHCHSLGLSRYKHPESLVIVETLPRNQFGKVIKKDLREAFG